MARVVNEAAHAAKRNAILDAAQRAIETKGYEQMAIADLLNELQMSSGAFYHYFDSKPTLLADLIERMGNQVEQLVLPIIHDPTLSALEKLRRFFIKLDSEKLAHKSLILAYLRVWYADENAIVRYKFYIARVKRLTPWLQEIINQGEREGIFTAPYPDQTARMMIALLEDFGITTTELLLAEVHTPDDLPRLERLVAAVIDAVERLLGAPTGSLHYVSRTELAEWLVPSPVGKKE